METVENASEGLHTEVYLPRISLSEKGGIYGSTRNVKF